MSASPAKSVELFSGAGGLALGMAQCGFQHDLLVEMNRDAVNTLIRNHDQGQKHMAEWNIFHGDVRNVSFRDFEGKLSVLAGGPPCQPFSLGGKHQAYDDNRDMFPQVIRGVRESRPDAFIFENVKGLLRQNFKAYFEYVILQLNYPDMTRLASESWSEHFARLLKAHDTGCHDGLEYKVSSRLLNAANYGVPQRRERVFIVGFRSDLDIEWDYPEETHSEDALLWDKWVSGDYWKRLNVSGSERSASGKSALKNSESKNPACSDRAQKISVRLQKNYGCFPPEKKPWVTVREAIGDLPSPRRKNAFNNHIYRDGAKSYPGHTGSHVDDVSKTLKAGVHGVPGGENMLRLSDGSIRYFTVREAARIQTFPDDYHISGAWTECMRQIGNAVPVALAEVVARSVRQALGRGGRATIRSGGQTTRSQK